MGNQSKIRILVLCTHNANRSQMAEGLLRNLGNDKLEIYSAGIEPTEVSPNAMKVMREIGVNMSNHYAKHIDEYVGQGFDYVITVCDEAAERCPFFLGKTTRLHWPFEDPSKFAGTDDEILARFRKVRDAIKEKAAQWLGGLNLLKK